MIALDHLKLSNIAIEHHKGISEWAFKRRLEPIFEMFEIVYREKDAAVFPAKELDDLAVNLGEKTKEKHIARLATLFPEKKVLADGYEILSTIYNDWDGIIKGLPKKLKELIDQLDSIVEPYREVDEEGKIKYKEDFLPIYYWLGHVFDYKSKFLQKEESPKKWDAYQLAEALKVDVCPYCNRQYTNTVIFSNKTKTPLTFEKIIRPEFDHFFPQSLYPYLALSFYNLVPCCKICNSSIKGAKEMNLDDYMHPYLEGYHHLIKFRTGIDPKDFLKKTDMEVPVALIKKTNNSEQQNRADNTADFFKIEKIYKIHSEIAREMFMKTTESSKKYLTDYWLESPNGSRMFDSQRQLYRHFIGNFMTAEEFHRRPLAKFQYDIAEETGLLVFIESLK